MPQLSHCQTKYDNQNRWTKHLLKLFDSNKRYLTDSPFTHSSVHVLIFLHMYSMCFKTHSSCTMSKANTWFFCTIMYLIIIIQFLSFYKDQWKLPNKTLINKSWKIFRMDTVSMTESTSMVIKFLPPEKCWVTVSTHGCARQPFIVLSKAARSDWHDGNTNRSRLFNANFKMSFIKSVKLIMFIWKPTEAIIGVTKTYRSASRWT